MSVIAESGRAREGEDVRRYTSANGESQVKDIIL